MAMMVIIPAEYLGYHNVFPLDSTIELFKHIGINNNPIDLVDNLLSYPLALQYQSSTRKMIVFDYIFEVLVT